MKTCTKCGEEKSLDDFHGDRRHKDGKHSRCKRCRSAQQDPAAVVAWRRSNIKRKFGISLDEYHALLAEPCAICGAESEVLDHCHASGHNRKALCTQCNFGLGHFYDDPARLAAAIDYLARH